MSNPASADVPFEKGKTLNEIDCWVTDELFFEQGRRRKKFQKEKQLIDIYNLKQEAIKEIKILMTDMKTPQDLLWEKMTGNTMEYVNKQILISYLKWKNNITEGDLK